MRNQARQEAIEQAMKSPAVLKSIAAHAVVHLPIVVYNIEYGFSGVIGTFPAAAPKVGFADSIEKIAWDIISGEDVDPYKKMLNRLLRKK